MAIAVRSVTNTTYGTATNTVLTPPTGLANNDILIGVSFRGSGTPPTVTAPTGFTQIGTEISLNDGFGFLAKISLYWKRAASESGNYTFTHSSCSAQGMLMAFSGCVTSGSPIDVSSQNSGTNSTSTATGITTTVANDLLAYIGQCWGDAAQSTPTGFTNIISTLTILAASFKATTTAGATGSVTSNNGNGVSTEPWSAFLIALMPAASGSPYTLPAATGLFSLAGQAATLRQGHKLVSASGSFALTGVAASLRTGRKFAAAAGAFNLAGQSANLTTARKLSASAGAFALTGINAALTYTPAGTHYTLTAAAGSFSLTGQSAALRTARKFPAIVGSFALSGQSASLRYSRTIPASAGSFTLSGKASSLRTSRNLTAAKGSFALTGFAATLIKSGGTSYTLTCDQALFLLTGYSASLTYTPIIGVTNPLERLKMYTGTLGAVSNREDWIVNISFVDDDGNALDISSAQSIGTYICRQGCPNSPVLTATLGNGIVLTDNFTMQWAFTESEMECLHPSQYDVFTRIELSNITTQILSASVAIIEGGPRQ